ncbi:hypothetical protein U1Q18_037563, partial [Sarracenia purpurea var. burkii]
MARERERVRKGEDEREKKEKNRRSHRSALPRTTTVALQPVPSPTLAASNEERRTWREQHRNMKSGGTTVEPYATIDSWVLLQFWLDLFDFAPIE